jgi:hemoglobin
MPIDCHPASAEPAADIREPADVDRLIAAFYQQVLTDPIIGFFFTEISPIDLERHLPVISAFWQQQLLGRPGYRGQTFARHRHLHSLCPLQPEHFHRWLYLFGNSVDALFRGPTAEAAKRRAARIAQSMQTALAAAPATTPEGNREPAVGFIDPPPGKQP